jgi:DNA-binding NarL/FixJ family response regulator
MSAQILIVDDSPFLRSSIRSSIEENTDWRVCGEAENGQVAI